ncbi:MULTISPECIES: GNAT family N-acetyltransferase [Bacillales]|uniref:GNAT family N-acetyltransferase n=1 Tax=Bacillales TaxID=1385 RepID=UPI000346766F|nr:MULTISPECIES: GNAT family N-acetyltransferase [Bacillales]
MGICIFSFFREKPAYQKSTELSIYIAPDQSGKGVGTTLMSAILERARHNSNTTRL